MWTPGTGWRGYRRYAYLRHDSRLFPVLCLPGRPLLLINLAGGGGRYHRAAGRHHGFSLQGQYRAVMALF